MPALLLLACGVAGSGCQTAGYYAQAVRGHFGVIARQESCAKLLADPDTPPELKAKLELARQLRDFAEQELGLPANGHYARYADLDRPFVVWNVSAAPEFSLESKCWRYPFVGRLDYRGYFDQRAAQRYADRLRAGGFDVCVEGAIAYSTLGWFKDPLLNTFIHYDEAVLAEILFHELAHQRVFARGDTDFNEAFATAVGQEGARRWLCARGDESALGQYAATVERNEQFARLIQETRRKLATLYGDQLDAAGNLRATKQSQPAAFLRAEKQRLFDELRRDYEQLKTGWGGYAGYDAWFAGNLNNARLNSVAAYHELVPAFERLLTLHGGDLEKFFATAGDLAGASTTERHDRLHNPPVEIPAVAAAD